MTITTRDVQQYNSLVCDLDPTKADTAIAMENFLNRIAESEGITGDKAQQQAARAIENFANENQLMLRVFNGR